MNASDPRAVLATVRNLRTGTSEDVVVPDPRVWDAAGVVGVTTHNQARQLRTCLDSIRAQRGLGCDVAILVVDDASRDVPWDRCRVALDRPDVVFVRARCGSAARSRNTVLDIADAAFTKARWVARLDADDRFATECSLAAATAPFADQGVTFVLGGNRLRVRGRLLDRTNPASRDLLHAGRVMERLEGMARGRDDAELPSCNLVLGRGAGWRYPERRSAEDHWLVAHLLLRHAECGRIVDRPFYADYTLEGPATKANHAARRYLASRADLLRAARTWLVARAVRT